MKYDHDYDPRWNDSRPEANMITASQLTGASPAGQYSWRPPSPPAILVPQTSESQQLVLPGYNGIGHQEEEREILKRITLIEKSVNGSRDWKYEWRRKAQSILTFLYLGPSSAARDLEFLRQEGITMLLVIRNTATAQASLLSGDKAARQLGIEATSVDVRDNLELIRAFPRAIKIINDHLISKYQAREMNPTGGEGGRMGKVLVFCESGNERSAAVVAAYLMSMYGQDIVAAMQYVQSQRFCVAFDDSLKFLLRSFQDLLEAQREVAREKEGRGEGCGKVKRGRAELEDGEGDVMMEMDKEDDVERFGGREGFTPFLDL